ncbi:MAG: TPM domain-containing protein [Mizugakiibacter sp.]|uniref:TPM domain-containing protein n=1 Tax=Mizugakiibacter sp. TaxID=1972610 RepID=UPI0031CAFB4C|nr:TPM domain-containing protein [Xanthomonadaceae bacterium]
MRTRLLRHLFAMPARRRFPAAAMDAIQAAIAAGEARHGGEVCFALEARLTLAELIAQRTPRQRAEQAFAHLRVWDTAQRTGVLLYLLLADHAIEIVADREVARHVPAVAWEAVCAAMRERFAADDWVGGAQAGIAATHDLLAAHLPPRAAGAADELPDRPVVL